MRLVQLNSRMQAVADYVRKDTAFCDIGTDHAHLPIYLVQNDLVKSAYACDINLQPLTKASENIASYGLADKIATLQSDGLQNVTNEMADDIAIAGMGGELICKIMFGWEYAKDRNKRYIIQPMTNQPIVRKQLYSNGYEIISETPVIDGKYTYSIMLVKYTDILVEKDEFFCNTGRIMESGSSDKREYISRQLTRIKKVADGIEKSGEDVTEYRELYKQIEGVL